jgi:WS/DGAT C-terminal domain/Wax ester synthase/diacylglycerol acyltransferase catalytic domain
MASDGTGRSTTDRVVRRLSAEDLSILALENETVAGHTCKVIVLGGSIDLDLLRASVSARLHRAPDLCMRLGTVDGEACWVSERQVDVSAHVLLCDHAGTCDEAALRAAVARSFEQRLDRSRPLWRIEVVPRLAGGGSALIWCIHHALADGWTAMHMAGLVLWQEEPRAAKPTRKHSPVTADTRSLAHHRFGIIRTAAREAPEPWLRSPFDGHISARREVAFATAELDRLRQVAHATNHATVNDAVLAVVAGGLRRWLEARHGHLGSVRVKVPVSLHNWSLTSSGQAQPGNRDSFFCLDLPLETADPLERLDAIRRATVARKEGHDAEHLDALMRELASVPRLRHFAERVLTHPRSFALNVSNVPGPHRPIHVLEAPVRGLYSMAEIRELHALRVAVVSHANTLSFGLVADPTILPDVDALAAGFQAEGAALTARPTPA